MISATWHDEGGAIVDPGAVTIRVDRADGTNLVPAGTATSGTGAAARTFTLTASDTALLDNLTAVWSSSLRGSLTTHVEVVGGFLFDISDARALKPLDNVAAYPAARIVAERTAAEMMLEDSCGVAFVPRYARRTVRGDGTRTLLLPHARVRAARSIAVDGVAFSAAEIAAVRVRSVGLEAARPLPRGSSVAVSYEHGHDSPPPFVSRAALLQARRWLMEQPFDERTTRVETDAGTISLLSAGRYGPSDLPEVNAAIAQYSAGPLVG